MTNATTTSGGSAARLAWLAILALGLVLGAAGGAAADEPPATDEAMPPPRTKERKPAGVEEAPTWSAPAATSPSGPTPGPLPPPAIRVRTRGTPGARPTPLQPVTPPIKDVPSTFPAPTAEREGTPAAPPAPGALRPRAVPATPSRVLSISKTHNLPGADGQLEMQIDVEYEVAGQAGREVYVAIWFVHQASQTYLRSILSRHADPGGYATVQTRAALVPLDRARYRAALRIPYGAFPVRATAEAAGSSAYDVAARVHVLRREPAARVRVLASDETTFRVYAGPPAEQPELESELEPLDWEGPAEERAPPPAMPPPTDAGAPEGAMPPPRVRPRSSALPSTGGTGTGS